ncbi:UvrD-helicase domain-containing protein [Salinifilum ghardaiensis]
MSTHVVMDERFRSSYSALEGSTKNRVLDFLMKLQERPGMPGLDLKTPEGVSDKRIKTARVTDFWRAVVIELPESSGYVLIAVKPHDDAYTYAQRLRFGVNEVTGALEAVDEASLGRAVEQAETASSSKSPTPVLKKTRARDLRRFGIDEDIAERLVAITDESQLLNVAENLPTVQGSAVLDLLAGRTPDEVWSDLIATEEENIDTSDVVQALQRPSSRLSFTGGRDVEELRTILEDDFKAWRVWLHPLQRKLAYHDGWRGPLRITGGAGTGKTVTAIHRARHLATRLETTGSEAKVLFTTFTKNLAQNIESQLRELAGAEIFNRVEVRNIDALATRILSIEGGTNGRPDLRGDSDRMIAEAWENARMHAEGQWDAGFLQAEWNQVVLAQGVEERAEYLRASRSGRGTRISRPQRADLWGVFERFTQLLNAQGIMTFTQAASRAARVAQQLNPHEQPVEDSGARRAMLPLYRHAIIDESQDLHPAHWRLLKALIPDDTDNMFIVGDAHQRIYGKPLVLSRYGIETRGRSRRLTVNYRTSRQILDWSIRVAYGQNADDLEGDVETLAGARSEFDGPLPETAKHSTTAKERSGLVEKLGFWASEGIPWGEMAVVTRYQQSAGELAEHLNSAGVPAAQVKANDNENTLGEHVRVMTMHRAKGLEYRAIALCGAGAKELPPASIRRLEGDEGEAAWARERSLLYVAGSRAREYLYISWVGEPSELLNTGHQQTG